MNDLLPLADLRARLGPGVSTHAGDDGLVYVNRGAFNLAAMPRELTPAFADRLAAHLRRRHEPGSYRTPGVAARRRLKARPVLTLGDKP